MIKGTLSVLAVTTALWLTNSIVGAAIALAATWGLLMLLYDLRSIAWLRNVDVDGAIEPGLPSWDWSALGRLTWLAFPIGVRVMLFTLCFNIPRYFIEEYHGEQQLGIFAALAYVTVVAQVLSNAIGQAAAPRLGSYYAAGDMVGFRVLVLKLAAAGAVLGGAGVVVALLVGEPLLILLYQPEYAEYADEFEWIMAASGLWCVVSMFVVAANAGRRQGSQAVAGVVITIVTIVASAVLIRSDPLDGAATASVVSAVAGLLVFGILFLTIGKPSSALSDDELAPIDEEIRGAL